MRHRLFWIGGVALVGLLAAALPAQAGIGDDFTLTRAVPADTMLAVHTRNHEGLDFLNQQCERVWKAVADQHFERDLKRMLMGMADGAGESQAELEQRWQQIHDLAMGVHWSQLSDREMAFAMTVAVPFGADFVFMFMPPADQVTDDFDGLVAILNNLVALAPEGQLLLSTEGEGTSVVHKLSVAQSPVPMVLTLARHDEVLLLGFGTSMAEKSLALLRGEAAGPNATLVSTARFQKALQQVAPPRDAFSFIEAGKLVQQGRAFAEMAAQAAGQQMMMSDEETEGAEGQQAGAGESPLAFLPRIVDEFDIWDYVLESTRTEGMKTTTEEVAVLRDQASQRAAYKVFFASGPLAKPLRFVPKEAKNVSVMSGFDLKALYDETVKFMETQVPMGTEYVQQFKGMMAESPVDIEQDLLNWLGTSFVSFSGNMRSQFMSDWVMIVGVRDEAKASAALEKLVALVNPMLMEQNGAIEDAELPEAPGFKRVILPPFMAMMPGLGRPILGVAEGHLFVGNGPEIVTLALQTGAGKHDTFQSNERYKKEGLPLGDNVTGFEFSDLSKLGEEIGQALAMTGLMQMMLPPDVTKHPAMTMLLSVATKLGRVARTLDFYQSKCSVTSQDGLMVRTRTVTNYQEPPKPAAEPKESKEPAEQSTGGAQATK